MTLLRDPYRIISLFEAVAGSDSARPRQQSCQSVLDPVMLGCMLCQNHDIASNIHVLGVVSGGKTGGDKNKRGPGGEGDEEDTYFDAMRAELVERAARTKVT